MFTTHTAATALLSDAVISLDGLQLLLCLLVVFFLSDPTLPFTTLYSSDLHTEGNTQWFYFAVSNTHTPQAVQLSEQGIQVPPVRVRFDIVNLTKPDSLFNSGESKGTESLVLLLLCTNNHLMMI